MNEPELTMPEVTEEDALRGQKEITVETRKGNRTKLIVKALPWRVSINVSQLSATNPSLAVIHSMEHCLDEEHAKDEFLDTVVPAHITWILNVALMLSNGVTDAKKRAAANKNSDSPTV